MTDNDWIEIDQTKWSDEPPLEYDPYEGEIIDRMPVKLERKFARLIGGGKLVKMYNRFIKGEITEDEWELQRDRLIEEYDEEQRKRETKQ